MLSMVLATLFSAATGAPAPPLPPAGKWVVDYDTDMCLVSREFGANPQQHVTLVINPSVDLLSPAATLFVLAPNDRGGGDKFGKGDVVLAPSGKSDTVDYVSAVLKDGKRGYKVYASAALMGDIAESSTLTIKPGKTGFAFATGNLRPVLAALEKCTVNLLKSWGVDPGAKAETLHGVNPGRWFPVDSYPAEAKRQGAQGRVVIVLTVSANGRPTACKVASKANPVLNDTTCQLAMRNSRFEPSAGKDDRFAIFAVRWVLGGF